MQEKKTGCKMQGARCKQRNKIQGKVQGANTVMSNE